jgi:hypothetical protein
MLNAKELLPLIAGLSIGATMLIASGNQKLGFSGTVAVAATSAPSPNPVFSSLVPGLKSGTSVPILLPSTVLFDTATRGPLYATVEDVDSGGYSIDFESTSTCNFRSYCNEGQVVSSTPSGSIDTSNYSSYQTINLSNGLSAIVAIPIYRQMTTITWDQGGRRYALIMGVDNFPQDLVTMANSMTQY